MELQQQADRIRRQRRALGHVRRGNPCPEPLKHAALAHTIS